MHAVTIDEPHRFKSRVLPPIQWRDLEALPVTIAAGEEFSASPYFQRSSRSGAILNFGQAIFCGKVLDWSHVLKREEATWLFKSRRISAA